MRRFFISVFRSSFFEALKEEVIIILPQVFPIRCVQIGIVELIYLHVKAGTGDVPFPHTEEEKMLQIFFAMISVAFFQVFVMLPIIAVIINGCIEEFILLIIQYHFFLFLSRSRTMLRLPYVF